MAASFPCIVESRCWVWWPRTPSWQSASFQIKVVSCGLGLPCRITIQEQLGNLFALHFGQSWSRLQNHLALAAQNRCWSPCYRLHLLPFFLAFWKPCERVLDGISHKSQQSIVHSLDKCPGLRQPKHSPFVAAYCFQDGVSFFLNSSHLSKPWHPLQIRQVLSADLFPCLWRSLNQMPFFNIQTYACYARHHQLVFYCRPLS